jgi:hypothetical protein
LFFNKELITLRGKTLGRRGVVARLKGKTSRLVVITRFNTKANIIVRILLLVYLLFLILDYNTNIELLRTLT